MYMDVDTAESVLEDSGLSPYEANAFVAILTLGDASASDIVDACTVPQPRIYDVLRSLDDEGLIETYETDTLRARVSDPETLVSELEDKAGRYAAAADKITEVWRRPAPTEHDIELFSEFDDIITRVRDGIRAAEHSVNIAVSGQVFLKLATDLGRAKDDGVVVNTSLYIEEGLKTDVSDFETYFENAASTVRYRKCPSPFLTVVDGEKSYFGASRRQTDYGMFIQDQGLSTMLYGYFQSLLWGRWETVYSDRTESFPKRYSNMRRCVAEVASHLQESADPLRATVDGYHIETGHKTRIEGEVTDTIPAPASDVPRRDANQTAIVVRTDSGEFTVGGFGAIVEDIRATSVRVTPAFGE